MSRITMDDVRRAGHCPQGARDWFVERGLDFRDFIKNGNVTLMVSDMDRAVKFYRDTLGLALTFRAGGEWAQLSGAGMTIGFTLVASNAARVRFPHIREGLS